MTNSAKVREELDRVLVAHGPEIASDPRVPLTLRVCGTGHRRLDPVAAKTVASTLSRIFERIRAVAEQRFQSHVTTAGYLRGIDLFVITPLAEGADRLIARAGLKNGFGLGAILPFEAGAYEATFDLGADRRPAVAAFREFLDEAELPKGYGVLTLDGDSLPEGQTFAYRQCASVLAKWSDILVTILEGDRLNSETGLSAQAALARGIPTIFVDPRDPDRFLVASGGRIPSEPESDFAKLDSLVAQLIASATTGETTEAARTNFDSYWRERVSVSPKKTGDFESGGPYRVKTVAPWWLAWFSGLNRTALAVVRRPFRGRKAAAQRRPLAAAWDLPFDSATAVPFVDLFLRHHRADMAANVYSALYRSAQLVGAFLGIAIVVVSVLHSRTTWFAANAIELCLLAYAAALVVVARRQKWLERWLEYRLVAEVLRAAKFLLVCGHSALFAEVVMSSAAKSASKSWTYGYCRNVLRSLRLAMPGRTRTVDSAAKDQVVSYVVDQCVTAQIRYHAGNVKVRDRADRALRSFAFVLVVATFAVVVLQLIEEGTEAYLTGHVPVLPAWLSSLLTTVKLILPTLAGTLIALRAYGEHSIVVGRSKALLAALELQREQIRAAPDIFHLQERLSAAIAAQLRDVDGWFELFSDKPLEM